MVHSDDRVRILAKNNKKHLALYQWWCEGDGNSRQNLCCLVSTQLNLNATPYLCIIADHVQRFHDHGVTIFLQLCSRVCVMSQSSLLLSLISWTWKWVHCPELASTVAISQSSAAPLGYVGTRDSHYGCAAIKHTACCHFNMDQKLWGMLPAPCWLCAMKNEQISEGVPVLARCTL